MSEFEQLYQQYARDVYRFALYLTGSPAQAEDITSETFVRVFTQWDNIRTGTVKAYLFTIARNLYVDAHRADSRKAELSVHFADPAPGPYLKAQDREALDAVLAALQQLPEVDRAALLMRAQDEMQYEDIAAALRISLASAKVKVHRARLRLTEVWAKFERSNKS